MNSTPVTPEPMTIVCSGISGGGYASRVVRTRSRSTVTKSGTRGREPVQIATKSAETSSSPPSVSTTIVCGSLKRAVPLMTRTCCDSRPVSSARWSRSSIDAYALAERLDVEMTLGGDAHRVRASELEQLTARRDQRFRRNAVPQVGGAAHDVALDQGDVGTERRRDARAGVAGGTTTKNDDTRHRSPIVRAEAAGSGQRNVVVMNDVRHDPVTGRVVIVAADRAARPHTLVQASSRRGSRPRALPVLPRARVR